MGSQRIRAVVVGMALAPSLCLPAAGLAGDVPMPTGIECVRDCPGSVPKTSHKPSHHYHGGGDAKAMVVDTLFGAILGAALAPEPEPDQKELQARQAAAAAKALAEQQARAAAAQAAYDRMMQSYKQLNDTANPSFKSISDTGLAFKPLGGELGAQAAGARAGFDTAAQPAALPPPPPIGTPTGFFGDTMPMTQIRTLVEPANDPRVVDLRKAKGLVVGSVKRKPDLGDLGTPIWTGPNAAECRTMHGKLHGFIDQQNKFHQTILLANEQVEVWEDANRQALINAAKEGLEFYAGKFAQTLARRGELAERMTLRLEQRRAQMLADGVDVQAIEGKIARLRGTAKLGKPAGAISDANDWQVFLKDGVSAALTQMNSSNREIFDDPVIQRYLNVNSPELQALADVSQITASAKVFGRWVARKMPHVALASFATNQIYNGADWLNSFYRLAEAHQINGKVTDAVMSLQRKIDDTRIALKQCS